MQAIVPLTEEDVYGQPVQLTEEDLRTETPPAPVQLTEEDVRQETAPETAPVQLTEADVAPETQQPGGALDILPNAAQASAGAANMLRGLAQAPLTLADKAAAAAQFSGRTTDFAPNAVVAAATMDPQGLARAAAKWAWNWANGDEADRSGLRAAVGRVRAELDGWRERNLGFRDEQGRPAESGDWGVTFGAQAANSLAEIYLSNAVLRRAGGGLGAGAPRGRFADLRPGAVSILYGLSQAESTAAKADKAGKSPAAALSAGAAAGAWETALESVSQRFGLQGTAQRAFGRSLARAMRERALNAVGEGVTEGAQSLGSATLEKLARIDDKTWEEIGLQAAVEAALGLTSAGAAEGGNAAAGRILRGAAQREQETRAAIESAAPMEDAAIADQIENQIPAQAPAPSAPSAPSAPPQAALEDQVEAEEPATPTAGQQAEAEAQARAAAARDKAKGARRGIGANVSDALSETSPVKRMVLEFGGIRMDGTEDQRGIPAGFRSANPAASTLDQMLTEIQNSPDGARYADWTADDLIDALKGNEADKRRRFASERPVEPAEREWLKRAWTIAPENLAVGFTFTVKGAAYRVADSDELGYLIERADGKADGWALRLDYGKLMNIDGGSLRNAKGRKIGKVRNYADPDQVRMWQEYGADEAAQAAEGMLPQEDEDLPFRLRDGVAQENSTAAPSVRSVAAPLSQLRAVRRGYDEARSAADDPAFSRWAQNPLDLPELVEFATDLLDGKVPRILKRLDPAGRALGSAKFRAETDAAGRAIFGRPEVISLLAANYRLISDDEEAALREDAEQIAKRQHGEAADASGKPLWEEAAERIFQDAYLAELKTRVPNGPRLAMAVIAHEIGHVADQAAKYGLVKPDRSKGANRLNLIGRVAGMLTWTRDILADDPSGRTLSADEVRTLQGRARTNAKPDRRGKELMRAVLDRIATDPELRDLPSNPALANIVSAAAFRDALEYMARERPVLSEWFSITTWPEQVRAALGALKAVSANTMTKEQRKLGSAWFRAEFVKGLEAQRQTHLGKMYSELETLIAWWNQGSDKAFMDKYFERPSEMFAEAFGVYLNNPGAVAKRAPMFYRTLLDYMGARPEVQEWLDAFNRDMERGTSAVYDRRAERLTDMFSKERRSVAREREKAGKAADTVRLAEDAARYMLDRKSGPLHAVIKTADALGLSWLTDPAAQWLDITENVAALEKSFVGIMNHEVGGILTDAGLTVQDFSRWAYLNMVAQSPAYTERANPLGYHPQAAREQIEHERRQMGDARANQLQKAVERFQEIWKSEVLPRLAGMYSAETMDKLRANPMYFTLMVGMDDAEIREFHTALQTLNADQLVAFANRSVTRTAFGQPVPAGLIRRSGTHRPAMDLFGATLLKGIRLINDSTRNRLAIATRDLLAQIKDPYYTEIPDGEAATDTPSQTVVRYFENGVKRAYYAPKYVGHFVRGDNPIAAGNNAIEAVRKYTLVNFWKQLQTRFSAKFMTTQPIADAKAWNTQIPGVKTPLGQILRGHPLGGLAQMIPASTWYLPASVFPDGSRERLMRPARDVIRKFYRTGEIDPQLRSLIERGMTDLNGAFQGMSRADPDAGEIAQLFAGVKPAHALQVYAEDLTRFQRGWQKLGGLPAFGRLFQATGRGWEALQTNMQVETLANKLAGMQYLDARYPDMSEREKRRWVLESAGNPNFAARAGADPFIDTLAWTFYNPAKEGIRSLVHAAKSDPAGFAARAMWYNVAPNLFKWGATTGVLYAVADYIIPHGETPDDEEDRARYMAALKNWLGWFKRIPTYYGRRYVAIPIQPVGTDSVLCVTIPQAQSLAPINGLFNALFDEIAQQAGYKAPDNKFAERAITAVTDELSGLNFLTGDNRSALVQVFGPIVSMLITDKDNVYDPFLGKNILDKNEADIMAGGRFTAAAWPVWQKLGKNAWNNAFGSAIGRFDLQTPRADKALKTDLQKVLTAPGMGSLVGGLLRVTGGGEFETLQDMFSAEGQSRAYDNLMVRKAALETLNDPQRRFPEWAAARYAEDPRFRRDWNEYIISHDIYSGMTPEERILYGRTNPVWKRMMLLRDRQTRQQ